MRTALTDGWSITVFDGGKVRYFFKNKKQLQGWNPAYGITSLFCVPACFRLAEQTKKSTFESKYIIFSLTS